MPRNYKVEQKRSQDGRKNWPLKDEYVKAFLQTATNQEKFSSADLILAHLLVDSGGRITEIINLKVKDIDFERSEIKLINLKQGGHRSKKGKKKAKSKKSKKKEIDYKYVKISDKLLSLLKVFIEGKTDNSYLFPSNRNPKTPISRWTGRRWVQKIAKEARIPRKVSPHDFRHTLSRDYEEAGVPPSIAMMQTGHRNADTLLRIYGQHRDAREGSEALRKVHAKYH